MLCLSKKSVPWCNTAREMRMFWSRFSFSSRFASLSSFVNARSSSSMVDLFLTKDNYRFSLFLFFSHSSASRNTSVTARSSLWSAVSYFVMLIPGMSKDCRIAGHWKCSTASRCSRHFVELRSTAFRQHTASSSSLVSPPSLTFFLEDVPIKGLGTPLLCKPGSI